MSTDTKRTGQGEDRRRVRTRSALLGAAQALFADRAVDGVSVDDIVLKAEVAKGSFYNHFADKDALAREIAGLVRREVEDRIGAANAVVTDPAARMARAISVFIHFALTDPERARVLMRLNSGATLAHAPANVGLRSDLEHGLAEGVFTDISVTAAVPFVMGACLTTMSLALEANRPPDFADETEAVLRAVLRGLGVPLERAAETARAAVVDVIKGEGA